MHSGAGTMHLNLFSLAEKYRSVSDCRAVFDPGKERLVKKQFFFIKQKRGGISATPS